MHRMDTAIVAPDSGLLAPPPSVVSCTDMYHQDGPIFRVGSRRLGIDPETAQRRAIAEGKIAFQAVTHGDYLGERLEKHQLPGLSSAGSWDAIGDQDWGLADHRNEGIEIVFLETGHSSFMVEGRTFDLRAGHCTVTTPWQLHRLGGPHLGPGHIHWAIIDVGTRRPGQAWRWPSWVCLDAADRTHLAELLQDEKPPVWTATPELTAAFRALEANLGGPRAPGWASQVAIHLNQILVALLRCERTTNQTKSGNTVPLQRVEALLGDLARNPQLAAEAWPIERMAKHCGLGTTTLATQCRALVNSTPVQYLTQVRLDHAAARLRADPRASITAIALANGFSSSQYFARLFRRRFRCSALAYRQQRAGT